MKKIYYIRILLMIFILQAFSIPSYVNAATKEIQVKVDGIPVVFDVPPLIENGRTLVPFRAIAEALQVEVVWDAQTKSIQGRSDHDSVDLQIGNAMAHANGLPVSLEAAPKIIKDRTFIPLRFFSEAFQADVKWDGVERIVSIQSPPTEMKVVGYYALGSTNGNIDLTSWTDLFDVPYPQTSVGHTDLVDELAFGWYSLDDQGNLLTIDRKTGWQKPSGWEGVLETAAAFHLETAMTILLPENDSRTMAVLGDQEKMERAIQGIIDEAKLFRGINLDIEGLGLNQSASQLVETKKQFTQFVRALYEQAKAHDLGLTLTLHPLNSSYKGYDYQALSQVSDEIIIMAYNYLPMNAPEPLAKVEEAIQLALKEVPKNKLILGVSAYHETPDSMMSKVGLVKRYKIKGIALWRLGLVTDEMWAALKSTIK